MPPYQSSISDVTHSAITFQYKKYAKVLTITSVVSQLGIASSNFSFDAIYKNFPEEFQQDLLDYLAMFPLVLGPLVSGYLLDKRYYRQTLLSALILALVGQAFITLGVLLYPANFPLTAIGRMIYALGFAMTMPALVRFLLMWLNPESIPIWLAVLFIVQIIAQTFGALLYQILLADSSLLTSQLITMGLCLFSLCFAVFLWYVDKSTNINATRDRSMLIQPVYVNFRTLLSLPFLIWAIIVATAATLTNLYIFQTYQGDFIQSDVSDAIAPQSRYLQIIFSGFCIVGLFIYGKILKVEKQKLGILMFEQSLAVLGLGVMMFKLSWITYIPAIAILAISQAGLYLTFFIIILSMMKWELLGTVIGIFYCFRNILVLGITMLLFKINSSLDDAGASDKEQFRDFIVLLLSFTGIGGFLISSIVYLMNRKKKLTIDRNASDENSALLQNYRNPESLNPNSDNSV